ncbi:MAG: S-layer homology domain-containing protein [Oscillospiraceae bacterium]|nr:S-layer homology domain-containing protein [Oscillospiraceae bacterium]
MKRAYVIIIAFIISLSLYPGLLAGSCSAEFDDISDQTVRTAATLLQNLGIVSGYGDGKFHPADNLTRAQFCKMAVMLSGTHDVGAYEKFTIFPDVRADHWGAGYINAAVRSLKMVTGYPDGTFKPDISVSFAQAVTTLMRLLGYTDSEVGLNWPHGYLDRASQIGLTKDLNLGANEAIDRGQAARLFYNVLFAKNASGTKYCDELGFTEVDAIIYRQDGTSPDGRLKGLLTIGGDGFYPCRYTLDIEEGSQGVLLVDGDGYALSWSPNAQTKKEITVKSTGPMSATGFDGDRIDNIPSDATVYINGEANTWAKCWIDIPSGLALRFFFGSSGVIDYIFLFQPTDDGIVKILGVEPAAGQNPLPSLGIQANAQVLKNGVAASWADLRMNDVLVYSEEANIVNATDFRLTGIYENALPNREAPDEVITFGGQNFTLLPSVRLKLAGKKIGESLTFLFTQDGRVADIRSESSPSYQPGITVGDTSVMLYNGMVISGENRSIGFYGEGAPVLASMSDQGRLNLLTITAKGGLELDIKSMKAGATDIAPYAVFFDLSGAGGQAAIVDRAALPDTINAADVISVQIGPAGKADIIILRNVTGDARIYGFTSVERSNIDVDEDGNVSGSRVNSLVIENQNGKQTINDPRSVGRDSGSSVYGVAIGTNGNVLDSKSCIRVNNVRRSDFSGNEAVMVSGLLRPIPEGLLVYAQATKSYISIAEARLNFNNFTVFLDKPAADGGKPRFIMAL